MTLILRTLEGRKLVSRKRNTDDTRRLIIDTTPKAIALIQKVAPRSNQIYQALEREFGRERLERLLDILEELTRTRA